MFSTSWIIPTQKTIKFLNAVSNEERTSRFYTMSYVGEDLLFDPTDCSIHSYSHPHNIRDSSTVVLSTYIVLNSLFKLFGDGRRPVTCFEALTLSLQDSDLQSNALRMGWWKCKKKIKKKTREREGKEMHLACFILVERLWRVWNVTFCCFSLICPSSGSSVHFISLCRSV